MSIKGCRGDAESQMPPSADALEFQLAGDNKLLVRSSETEPKIKSYLFARGETQGEADEV